MTAPTDFDEGSYSIAVITAFDDGDLSVLDEVGSCILWMSPVALAGFCEVVIISLVVVDCPGFSRFMISW